MKLLKITSSILLAGALATTSLQAKDTNKNIDVYAGYSSGTVDGKSSNGATVGYAVRMNTTNFQNSLGMEATLLGNNDDAEDGTGNLGLVFLSSGYKVTDSLIPYALIGYAFQDLGTDASGTSNLSTGFAYGAGIKYQFAKSFAIDANYKGYSLKDSADYQYNIHLATVSLVYSF
jgi:putative virulence related protein PagC